MTNRRLTKEELQQAQLLLANIRLELGKISNGDKELRFAFNRKIYKELIYDERGKPLARRKLKQEKFRHSAACAQSAQSHYPKAMPCLIGEMPSTVIPRKIPG